MVCELDEREVLGVSGKTSELEEDPPAPKVGTAATAVWGTEGNKKDMSFWTLAGSVDTRGEFVAEEDGLEYGEATDELKDGVVEATGVCVKDGMKEEEEEDVEDVPMEEKAAEGSSIEEREEEEKELVEDGPEGV